MKRKVFITIAAFAAVVLFSGCKTQERIVNVIETRTDTTYITHHERDSIFLHDSIRVRETDSIMFVERWHTKYIERTKHDTIREATHDTVPLPYPVEVVKQVEKPLTWWQLTRMHAGTCTLVFLILYTIWLTKGVWLKALLKIIKP